MLGDMRERALRRTRKRRERGIVLDRAECGLPGERDFDARVQDASRIERILYSSEERERFGGPDCGEQRRAEPAVTVLAGERSVQLSRERHDIIENARDALAPPWTRQIDQRVRMDVRVARVAEEDAARVVTRER